MNVTELLERLTDLADAGHGDVTVLMTSPVPEPHEITDLEIRAHEDATEGAAVVLT